MWHSTGRALIKKTFKVVHAGRAFVALLKRMGAELPAPRKQQIILAGRGWWAGWADATYPAIKADAKKRALIFWQDETSLKQDANWVRGWAPVGETPCC